MLIRATSGLCTGYIAFFEPFGRPPRNDVEHVRLFEGVIGSM